MTGLVLRKTSLNAVNSSLVQYNRMFESSYDASFDEGRISIIRKDEVFRGFLQGAGEASNRH